MNKNVWNENKRRNEWTARRCKWYAALTEVYSDVNSVAAAAVGGVVGIKRVWRISNYVVDVSWWMIDYIQLLAFASSFSPHFEVGFPCQHSMWIDGSQMKLITIQIHYILLAHLHISHSQELPSKSHSHCQNLSLWDYWFYGNECDSSLRLIYSLRVKLALSPSSSSVIIFIVCGAEEKHTTHTPLFGRDCRSLEEFTFYALNLILSYFFRSSVG